MAIYTRGRKNIYFKIIFSTRNRPLKRFIQSHVETLIGRMIIADEIGPDSVVTLDSDGEQLTVK